MAMTIGDANDVQTLARWVLGSVHDGDSDVRELAGDQARDALARLLDRSQKVLMAGSYGSEVDRRWSVPGLPRGCKLPAAGATT